MSCNLKDFKLPDPDVRLVTISNTVFKIKLRFRHNNSATEEKLGVYFHYSSLMFWKQAKIQYDIERVIIYILLNQSNIEPIRTDQLVIYPYKKEWLNSSKLCFSRFDESLKTSPYLFMFFIERISDQDFEPPAKIKKDTVQSELVEQMSSSGKIDEKKTGIFLKDVVMDPTDDCDTSSSDAMGDSFDSSIKERKNGDNSNQGYVLQLYNLLVTPMKKIRTLWK